MPFAGDFKISDKKRMAVSGKFRRFDDDDTSTLFCTCGSSFEWHDVDDRLAPWLEAHTPHVEAEKADA